MRRYLAIFALACLTCGIGHALEDAQLELVSKSEGGSPAGLIKAARSEGLVFITNKKSEEISIEWEVSLAKNLRGTPGYERIPEYSFNEKSMQRVNWMVDQKEAEAGPIYFIRVSVYRDGANGKQLLTERTYEKTLNAKQLFGESLRNNLYITVENDNSVEVFVGKTK